jgi:N-acetylneuraminate synthase
MNRNEIAIGSVKLGEGLPVATIAEAACEHLGSLEVAFRIVDAAKEAGADFIKFQMHLPEEMVPGSIHFWGGSMDEVLERYNLSIEDHARLIEHCRQAEIQYLCTPFSSQAADILDELGVDGFKTGSGEMTNLPMLRNIARKGKPLIVSTGMARVDEIMETVHALKEEGAGERLILTHCTSAYPPKCEQINLRFIPRLGEMTGLPVGHSDHTPDIWTALGAVALGARVVEKHFTLDRGLKGPDYHISLEPLEFGRLVEAIRCLEKALGDEKTIYPEEEEVRDWAHHSVVALCDIAAGTVLTPEMLGVKRPGRGVPAKHLEEFYGSVVKRSMTKNHILQWDDLEKGRKR